MPSPHDGDRLVALLATHGPALRRLARVHAPNPADQDDLFQEIAVAIWRSLPGFRGESSERTWIYRVAHNVAATFWTRNRRARGERAHHEVTPGAAPEPEARMDLVELVRRLPPFDRQLVTLYLEGLTAPEIADVTGLSATNVAVRLTRARKTLAAAAAPLPRSTP